MLWLNGKLITSKSMFVIMYGTITTVINQRFNLCSDEWNQNAPLASLAIITNSDLPHGLEFDCNQEALLVQGVRPLIDFNKITFSDDY